QLSMAPRPRAPQPIRPIRISSVPAAWTFCNSVTLAASAVPAAKAVDFRNCRRLGSKFVSIDMVYSLLVAAVARNRAAQVPEIVLFGEWPDDAEADKVGIGQPPDALRALRISPDPPWFRGSTGSATASRRIIGPRAAANHISKAVPLGK